jgi:hypothetical protein
MIMNKWILFLIAGMIVFSACRKKAVYDYEVNSVPVNSTLAGKDKEKTEQQYIAILYANLFQKALSVTDLIQITDLIESIGDKDVAHEIVISNFMNRPDIVIPERDSIMQDLPVFINETFQRFYVRQPTAAEFTYFETYINTHPTVTPELVYFSFALSNEYRFY